MSDCVVLPLRGPLDRAVARLAADVARALETERAHTPRAEDWLRVVAAVIASAARDYGVERELLAELMSPTQHHAWEALDAALAAWPGPCPAEAPAWRRLALARTDEEREAARAELRRLGLDPG